MKDFTLERAMGTRCFTKADGKVWETQPTGKLGPDGKPEYADVLMSDSRMDARAALSIDEYKKVDTVVTEVRNDPERISTWMRGLPVVVSFDGLSNKMFYYARKTSEGSSRVTMDMEDDAPGTSIKTERAGVPLPLEFASWNSSIRTDATASKNSGMDVIAEKAQACAEAVAKGLDLRQVNGWGSLTYNGYTVYGFRDVPTNLSVTQAGNTGTTGWLDSDAVSTTEIYKNIVSMVQLLDAAKVPGPYALLLPKSFRHRLAETYSSTITGVEKNLWTKLLESPANGVPNVLGISSIYLAPELDVKKGGDAPTVGEAYLVSLSPKYFRVLNYMAMASYTMDLKSSIMTKHNVFEGLCPLFKTDYNGNYGIVKLDVPATT